MHINQGCNVPGEMSDPAAGRLESCERGYADILSIHAMRSDDSSPISLPFFYPIRGEGVQIMRLAKCDLSLFRMFASGTREISLVPASRVMDCCSCCSFFFVFLRCVLFLRAFFVCILKIWKASFNEYLSIGNGF